MNMSHALVVFAVEANNVKNYGRHFNEGYAYTAAPHAGSFRAAAQFYA
jgi:hypothetical protein